MKRIVCLGMMAAGVATAATLTENVTLDADADWRGQGTVTIADGVTLDLNGHVLRVSGIAGAGRIVDSRSYDILDFVESTGAQRIVTDLVPGSDTIVDAVAAPTVDGAAWTLFGTKSWNSYRFLCMAENNKWYFFGKGEIVCTYTTGARYRFLLSTGKAVVCDGETGEQLGNLNGSFANNDGTELAICGLTDDSKPQFGRFKVYSFKVWHENAMRFDFVPARNPHTGAVGLLNRLDGTLHASETATPFGAGTAVGALGIGALRVEASSEAALAGFTGTVDGNVRLVVDGSCTLAANADWRAFGNLAIDGTVDLAGKDLRLSALAGVGMVTDSADAYDQLEYVESSGRQMVQTGIVPSTDTGLTLDMTMLDTSSYPTNRAVFGCKTWGTRRFLLILAWGQFRFFGNNNVLGSQTAGTQYRLTIVPGTTATDGIAKIVRVADGDTLGDVQVNLTNSDNSELRLFDYVADPDVERDNTGASYRLHSFQMTKGGTTVRDLVPARQLATGKVGLLDRVSGDFLTCTNGTELIAGPSVAKGRAGRLRVEVTGAGRIVNDSLALSGGLELVKEGTGTLVVNRRGQTYNGGNRVAGGVLDTMCAGPGLTYLFISSRGYLGRYGSVAEPGSDIVVDAGAVFDFRGSVDYRYYNIVLNGGTLRNGGHDQDGTGSLGPLTLTADSTMDVAHGITFYDSNPIHIDLGGHTLTVATAGNDLYFRNIGTITNGTFALEGNGRWHVNQAVTARGVSLRTEAALWLNRRLDVDDYYAACTTNVNDGAGGMNVYGRFTPATDYFYGCTLQDGSTLDLNGRTGAWSTTSAFTNGLNRVTFAEGATVTVDAHARPTWSGKVVDWGAGQAPADVQFVLDDASKAAGRAMAVRDDGIYAIGGFTVIVR